MLADGEYLKVLLLVALPHRLQNTIWVARLELGKTLGSLHSSMAGISTDLSRKTIVSPEYHTERILDIKSLIRILLKLCSRCFGNSSSFTVSNLMMVNNIHQGLVLHRILFLFDIDSFIHDQRVAPG